MCFHPSSAMSLSFNFFCLFFRLQRLHIIHTTINNPSASISCLQQFHPSIFSVFSSDNGSIYSGHVSHILFNFIFFSLSSYHVRYTTSSTDYISVLYFSNFFTHMLLNNTCIFCVQFNIYYCIYSIIHSQLFF